MTWLFFIFFFNDTATTEIYTLSLHDALPISETRVWSSAGRSKVEEITSPWTARWKSVTSSGRSSTRTTISFTSRSEEHTSELQSRQYLVCRLLLEKKKKPILPIILQHHYSLH